MKLSKLIIAFSLITASATSVAVLAHEHDAERHQGKSRSPVMHMLKGLELSASQQQQIKTLVQQHRGDMEPRKERKDEMAKMQALMQAEQFDEAAVRALLQQHQQQRLENKLSILKLQHDIRQLLTTEQREELDKKRQRRQEKHHPDA